MGRKETHEDFTKRLKARNMSPLEQYKHSTLKIKVQCLICDNVWSPFASSLRKHGCPSCAKISVKITKTKSNEAFITEMRRLNISPLSTYSGVHTHIDFKCKLCNHTWNATPHTVLNIGCSNCNRIKRRVVKNKELLDSIVNKDVILLGDYMGSRTPIKTKCEKCKHIWYPVPSDLKSGRGCPKCVGKYKTTGEFSKLIKDDLKVIGEYKGVNEKIKIACKKCSFTFCASPSNLINGSGCPKCAPISDRDIIYIWEALGERWNDKPIFKIGTTSKRLGVTRINTVAREFGFDLKIHLYKEVNDALINEAELLKKFTDKPKMNKNNGFTEFRAINRKEIDETIRKLQRDYE